MSKLIRYFPCPACGAALSMNSSRMVYDTVREQYTTCPNEHCGGAFVIRSEIVNQLSPTADIFAKKVKHIPLMSDIKKVALDLAVEYLGRSWQSDQSHDDKIISCRKYLQENVQLCSATATTITELAIADWACAGYESWSVDNETHKVGVIINEGPSKQHVISLPELVDLIESKNKNKLL